MLDQQPLVFVPGLAQLDEHETAAKPFAVELELEIAFRELLVDAERPLRRIRPLIPYNHFAAAVLAFWDRAFELAVFEWMIFDLHRQAFIAGIERRTFGNSPGLQYTVDFETQVVVKVGRGVFLHHKCTIAAVVSFAAGRFRSFFEIALLLIFVQHGVGLDSRHTKNECDMIQPETPLRTKSKNRRQVAPPAVSKITLRAKLGVSCEPSALSAGADARVRYVPAPDAPFAHCAYRD